MKTVMTGGIKISRITRAAGLATLAGLATMAAQANSTGRGAARRTKITAAQAGAVAVRKFHGTMVGHPTLENEEGKWQYGVMVKTGRTLREVMVGAYSGKIENVEVTTAAKEGVEKQADAAAEKAARHKSGTAPKR